MNTVQQMQALEKRLSDLIERPVEITIRSESEFTFSFEGIDQEAAEKLADHAQDGKTKIEIETDDDIEMTFVYLSTNH